MLKHLTNNLQGKIWCPVHLTDDICIDSLPAVRQAQNNLARHLALSEIRADYARDTGLFGGIIDGSRCSFLEYLCRLYRQSTDGTWYRRQLPQWADALSELALTYPPRRLAKYTV